MSTTKTKKLMTTAEAATALQITDSAIRHAIKLGTINAEKFGRAWMVDITGLGPRTVGRPRSNAPRCKCGLSTLRRAKIRNFDCCRKAGKMPKVAATKKRGKR